MPIQYVKAQGGYRWGKHGKVYPIKNFGKQGAYVKAMKQGQAIETQKSKSIPVKASKRAKGYVKEID